MRGWTSRATPDLTSDLCDVGAFSPHAWRRIGSHHIGRREAAFALASFDLNRRMMDAEAILEFVGSIHQEAVAGLVAVAHEMNRQRRFRRAHGPDVQIMNAGNTR